MPEIHTLTFIPSKILSPIDFCSSSQGAVEMAADLAERFQAELYLVNVIPTFPTTTLLDFATEADYIQQASTNASNRLAKCHLALTARGVKSTFYVQVGHDIAGNIVEVVERENIELVVISTHGITGWYPLVVGSIAEKVVRLAKCPHLLLRSATPEASVKPWSTGFSRWW